MESNIIVKALKTHARQNGYIFETNTENLLIKHITGRLDELINTFVYPRKNAVIRLFGYLNDNQLILFDSPTEITGKVKLDISDPMFFPKLQAHHIKYKKILRKDIKRFLSTRFDINDILGKLLTKL